MTTDATAVALAAVIDALALVQGQLDRLERSNGRIEAAQRSILDRLDTIDAGQAAVTELVPVLEMILARSIEDREAIDSKLSRIAQVAAFAHAASLGNGAPLPVAAADDPLLEQFLLTQPADRISVARALIDWRGIAAGASSADLTEIIARQYQPSPTDTAETRVLRYQLAAITRAELQGRGGVPPLPPASTRPQDRSVAARRSRSVELARLWAAGESTALFADPELAGALDLFQAAERRGGHATEEQLSTELAELHRALASRLEAGERPFASEELVADVLAPAADIEADRPR
ncbi:hypothetical protein ACYZX9_19410 (plasmid) [Sphingomonas citri]|jgi:hypothetical protein|uniref:hypothetical protein n=1 Tax=Sphingomonas sp. TX0522 TaxID=2479205 RepID=UPI0018DF5726|nr:hypothetical protein [Sphingomonas sp. TX0522]MBI0533587.1 hypothetical protein [Sphingomonas sp. TX0522]